MMSLRRRFVNLVSSDCRKRVYSLRRIDMSRFFLPTATKNNWRLGGWLLGGDSTPPMKEGCSLPEPKINLYSPESLNHFGRMDFMLLDKKVVATDGVGGAYMYDTDMNAVRSLPSHERLKPYAVSVAVDNNLYIIDRITNGSKSRRFESLVNSDPNPYQHANWHWQTLPPPPPPPCLQNADTDTTRIDSCAVVTKQIWFTARGRDGVDRCTYSFDTERLAWSDPVDWALPFSGSAEHIPELRSLWFGISSEDHGNVFCASNLAAASVSLPPALHQTLEDDTAVAAKDWTLVSAHSVYLGSGKFCIARFFNTRTQQICPKSQRPREVDHNFLVLAGVEVLVTDEGKLRLVKHQSERYMFDEMEVHWVL
ncbi:hypothetical protein QOZ80_2BG0206150 [Eleusine coracana subsp. coracana]|nr:hypothetical protein QOZ80_2BG0206150 [Eleusine coracana subsp. coracana]